MTDSSEPLPQPDSLMNALKRFHSIVSDEEKYMSSKLIAYNTSNEFSLKKMEEIHGIKKFELINFPWIGYQPKQCDICREKDSCDKDPLVQCSICKFYVHKNCYSRPISPVVSWICQRCIFILENPDFSHLKLCCALCKSFKGLLTLVQNEYWVHIECVFWCPMLSFEDSVEKDTVIGNFDPIAVSKNMSICLYCQKKGIILTKCDYPSCKIKFCTRCAGFYRWIIKGCTQMEKQEGENGQLLFCEFHQQEGIKKIVKQKQTKLNEFYLEDKKVLDVMEPINKISERLNEVCKANKEIKSQNKNFNLKHEKLETKVQIIFDEIKSLKSLLCCSVLKDKIPDKLLNPPKLSVCTLQNISISDNPGSPSPELPLQPSLESLGLGGIEIEFSKENEYEGTDASQVFNTDNTLKLSPRPLKPIQENQIDPPKNSLSDILALESPKKLLKLPKKPKKQFHAKKGQKGKQSPEKPSPIPLDPTLHTKPIDLPDSIQKLLSLASTCPEKEVVSKFRHYCGNSDIFTCDKSMILLYKSKPLFDIFSVEAINNEHEEIISLIKINT